MSKYKVMLIVIKKFLKIISKILLTLLGIYIFLMLFNFVQTYIMQNEMNHSGPTLSSLINSIIGVPHFEEPYFKNDAENIIKISKEEWWNFRCEPKGGRARSRVVHGGDSDSDLLPQEKKAYLNCISVRNDEALSSRRKPKSIKSELCKNYFNCQMINVSVRDHVLQRPEILENMIKIAKRPCDYIRRLEDVRPEEDIIFKSHFSAYRSDLHCNVYLPFYMNKRIFIVITVYNQEAEEKMNIIVRREDID